MPNGTACVALYFVVHKEALLNQKFPPLIRNIKTALRLGYLPSRKVVIADGQLGGIIDNDCTDTNF